MRLDPNPLRSTDSSATGSLADRQGRRGDPRPAEKGGEGEGRVGEGREAEGGCREEGEGGEGAAAGGDREEGDHHQEERQGSRPGAERPRTNTSGRAAKASSLHRPRKDSHMT